MVLIRMPAACISSSLCYFLKAMNAGHHVYLTAHSLSASGMVILMLPVTLLLLPVS